MYNTIDEIENPLSYFKTQEILNPIPKKVYEIFSDNSIKYIVPELSENQYKFLDWNYISSLELHPYEYDKYLKYLNWDIVSEHISYELAYKYEDLVNWNVLLKFKQVPVQDLIINGIQFDWDIVFTYQKLCNSFLESYIHFINDTSRWNLISQYQILDYTFIIKYINKLTWYNIINYQNLSKEFIIKHLNEINYELLCFLDDKFSDEEIELFKTIKSKI